jgi:hypothetical protein
VFGYLRDHSQSEGTIAGWRDQTRSYRQELATDNRAGAQGNGLTAAARVAAIFGSVTLRRHFAT